MPERALEVLGKENECLGRGGVDREKKGKSRGGPDCNF